MEQSDGDTVLRNPKALVQPLPNLPGVVVIGRFPELVDITVVLATQFHYKKAAGLGLKTIYPESLVGPGFQGVHECVVLWRHTAINGRQIGRNILRHGNRLILDKGLVNKGLKQFSGFHIGNAITST